MDMQWHELGRVGVPFADRLRELTCCFIADRRNRHSSARRHRRKEQDSGSGVFRKLTVGFDLPGRGEACQTPTSRTAESGCVATLKSRGPACEARVELRNSGRQARRAGPGDLR